MHARIEPCILYIDTRSNTHIHAVLANLIATLTLLAIATYITFPTGYRVCCPVLPSENVLRLASPRYITSTDHMRSRVARAP